MMHEHHECLACGASLTGRARHGHSEECQLRLGKELESERMLMVAKELEHEFLERALRSKGEWRNTWNEPTDEEESKGAAAKDVGMEVEGAAASSALMASSSAVPTATPMATSSASTAATGAQKRDPAYAPQARARNRRASSRE